MADAKQLERTYTIPLRREFLKVPKYKRAKKATTAIKQFLSKHMKSDDVRVGTAVNEKVWEHGMRNPPSKVKVQVVKDEKGVVRAELFGAKAVEKKEVSKKAAKKETKAVEEKAAKKPEVSEAVAVESKAETAEAKPAEKTE